MRQALGLMTVIASCGLFGCATSHKPPVATQAPKPVVDLVVLDEVDPPSPHDRALVAPKTVVLPAQYEASWQVIDGEGRWVMRKVSDRPASPNLQPGLLSQEVGLVTAESLRLSAETVKQLQQISADSETLKRELARIAKKQIDAQREKDEKEKGSAK